MAKYITGDFAAAKSLISDLMKLSRSRTEVSDLVAEETLHLIRKGFRDSEDPEGNSWEPLKFRDGKPLVHTGELANSFSKYGVSRRGFKIRSSFEHVETHQDSMTIKGPGAFPVFDGMAQKSVTDLAGFPVRKNSTRSIAASRRGRALAAGNVTWLPYHVVTVPQRQMVPETDLPEKWERSYERVISRYLSTRMKNKVDDGA